MVTQSASCGGELNVDHFVLWDSHNTREYLRPEATRTQKQKQNIYVDELQCNWTAVIQGNIETQLWRKWIKSLPSWSFLCSGKRQIINKQIKINFQNIRSVISVCYMLCLLFWKPPLSYIRFPYMCRSINKISILFPGSICLALPTFLITIALE